MLHIHKLKKLLIVMTVGSWHQVQYQNVSDKYLCIVTSGHVLFTHVVSRRAPVLHITTRKAIVDTRYMFRDLAPCLR